MSKPVRYAVRGMDVWDLELVEENDEHEGQIVLVSDVEALEAGLKRVTEERDRAIAGLIAAAKSLDAIRGGAGKDLLEDVMQVRGYAYSRAMVARRLLDELGAE